MSNRSQRALIAQQTLQILETGAYSVAGQNVSIREPLEATMAGTQLYTPDALDELQRLMPRSRSVPTKFRVTNETTLAAARRQVTVDSHLLCLNFASAKNPGGGFLGGSQAQEESLARATGLYASLQQQPDYYAANRNQSGHGMYTHHLIYSPGVPVFRDDDDELLPEPYCVSMVTSPAVNAGAVRKNAADQVPAIEPTMKQRMRFVLAVALAHGYQHLILGAWGCGVFRNDPVDVARWFADVLGDESDFGGCFAQVDFAVLDRTSDLTTLRAFQNQFGSADDRWAAS